MADNSMHGPSGPIQVPPLGLLGLLQLKSPQGRNPTWLQDVVQPTVDLFQMWMQARVEDVPATNAPVPTGTGGNVSFTTPMLVPANEVWWVDNFSLVGICAAGDTIKDLRPAIRYNFLATSAFGFPGDNVASATANQRATASARGFWVQPGNELLVYHGGATSAGNITVLAYCHRTILRI